MRLGELVLPLMVLLAAAAIGCSSSDSNGTGGTGGTHATGGSGGSGGSGGHAGAAGGGGSQPDGGTGGAGGVEALQANIDTSLGLIVIDLNPGASPITVANFQAYADAQFYDGLIFHRVIPDFMIQGGGLNPDMSEKATLFPPIVNEAVTSGLSNLAGTIAMARTNAPNSATSQFFINTVDNTYLDPSPSNPAGYAVFGMVTQGMDVVHTIEAVATHSVGIYDDVPVETVLINSITVQAP